MEREIIRMSNKKEAQYYIEDTIYLLDRADNERKLSKIYHLLNSCILKKKFSDTTQRYYERCLTKPKHVHSIASREIKINYLTNIYAVTSIIQFDLLHCFLSIVTQRNRKRSYIRTRKRSSQSIQTYKKRQKERKKNQSQNTVHNINRHLLTLNTSKTDQTEKQGRKRENIKETTQHKPESLFVTMCLIVY